MTEDALNVGHSSDPLTAPDRPSPSVSLTLGFGVEWDGECQKTAGSPQPCRGSRAVWDRAAFPGGASGSAQARAGLGGPGAREPGGRAQPSAGGRSRSGLTCAPQGTRWPGSPPAGFLQLSRPTPTRIPSSALPAILEHPCASVLRLLEPSRWVVFPSGAVFPGAAGGGRSSLPTAVSTLPNDGSTEAMAVQWRKSPLIYNVGQESEGYPCLSTLQIGARGQVIYTFLATLVNTGTHCRI